MNDIHYLCLQVAFGSDFSDPEWKDVYKLKYSDGDQGLFYLVSHALRGTQLALIFPLFRVRISNKCARLNWVQVLSLY